MTNLLQLLSGAMGLLGLGVVVGLSASGDMLGHSLLRAMVVVAVFGLSLILLIVSFLPRRAQVAGVGMGLMLVLMFGALKGADALIVHLALIGVIKSGLWPPTLSANPWGAHQYVRSYNSYLGRLITYRTNELGFRGGPLRADTKKILLLGDSPMFGMNVPEEATYAGALERMLGPQFQILNGAWPGTSTFRQEQTLSRYFYAVPAGLDAVVVGYFDNDPPDNAQVMAYGLHGMYVNKTLTRFDGTYLRQVVYRDFFAPVFLGWNGFRLVALQARAAWGRIAGRPTQARPRCRPVEEMGGSPYDKITMAEFARGVALTVAGMRRIAAVARLSGARTYVLYLPWGENSVHHFLNGSWVQTGHAVAYNRLKAESGGGGYEFIDGVRAVAEYLKARGIDPCRLPREYYSWPEDFTHSSPLVVQVIAREILRVWKGS